MGKEEAACIEKQHLFIRVYQGVTPSIYPPSLLSSPLLQLTSELLHRPDLAGFIWCVCLCTRTPAPPAGCFSYTAQTSLISCECAREV